LGKGRASNQPNQIYLTTRIYQMGTSQNPAK
jgi:hypothetical protein